MGCRAAAERFGIAPAAAVTWRRLWLKTGSVAPPAQGGDTRPLHGRAVSAVLVVDKQWRVLGQFIDKDDLVSAQAGMKLERFPC